MLGFGGIWIVRRERRGGCGGSPGVHGQGGLRGRWRHGGGCGESLVGLIRYGGRLIWMGQSVGGG